jgi:hypothetical protein
MVAFVFFYIRFGSLLLKEKNFFRKRKIGLNTQISLLPRWEKKMSKLRLRRTIWWPPSCVFFFPYLEIWWPLGHSMLNYEGRFGGHYIIWHWTAKDNLVATKLCFFFPLFGDLVATRSFHVKLWRTIWWPLYHLTLDCEGRLGGH